MEKLNNVEWEKLKPETADFIFGESEKLLINQIETSKLLTKRAETIIGFAVPILIVIVGYVVNFISQFDANIESQGYLPLVAGVYSSAAIIIILAFSIDVFWIYQIRPCGNNPRGMISQWKIDSPNQYVAFVYWRIKSIQRLIDENAAANHVRIEKLKNLYTVSKWSLIGILGITMGWLLFQAIA